MWNPDAALNPKSLDWAKGDGLLPAIIQHHENMQVLMLGYMNESSLEKTIATGKVTFFSRSRNQLWTKGETSGNYLHVADIQADCDQDAILVFASPDGPTCHTGQVSCFTDENSPGIGWLNELQSIVTERENTDAKDSYTAKLFQAGTKRIAQKVGEEGVETALAAMAGDRAELVNESADLLFHLIVLLRDQGVSLADVVSCLRERHASR